VQVKPAAYRNASIFSSVFLFVPQDIAPYILRLARAFLGLEKFMKTAVEYLIKFID
jgi:hypothetical protein